MAVVNLTATGRNDLTFGDNRQVADPLGLMCFTSTVEVGSADTNASTYWMARLPSDARICGLSEVSFDDLASAGAPTIDIGTFAVEGNLTDDADALNDGIDVATAAGTARVVKDRANYGKALWEYAGAASDPGGFIDVKVTLADAAVNAGGTLTMTMLYY